MNLNSLLAFVVGITIAGLVALQALKVYEKTHDCACEQVSSSAE